MNRIGACTAFLLALSGCVTNTVAPIQSAPQIALNQAKPNPAPTATRPDPAVIAVSRAALSGVQQQIDFLVTLNADCSSPGYATVRVVTLPAHGVLTNEQGTGYSNYPKDTQRYECNVKKSPGVSVRYKSEAGYIGSDITVIDVIYADGFLRRLTYTLAVK